MYGFKYPRQWDCMDVENITNIRCWSDYIGSSENYDEIVSIILPGFSISVKTDDSPRRVWNEIREDNVTIVKVIDGQEEVGCIILFCQNNMVKPILESTVFYSICFTSNHATFVFLFLVTECNSIFHAHKEFSYISVYEVSSSCSFLEF